MATKIKQTVLDTINDLATEVFATSATSRATLAGKVVGTGWAFTVARMNAGNLMVLEYQALRSAFVAKTGSDKDVPTEALTDRVLAEWATLNVAGHKWDTIADWSKSYDAYQGLDKQTRKTVADYGNVTITTLKDLAQVPVDKSENKDGKPVPPRAELVQSIVDSGEKTDRVQREMVKAARNGGTLPKPKTASRADQAKSIQNKGAELIKTLALPATEDHVTFTLDLAGIKALITFGVSLRDVAGSKDALAYRDAIDEMVDALIPESDESIAVREAEAAALADAIAVRESAQAALAANDAS